MSLYLKKQLILKLAQDESWTLPVFTRGASQFAFNSAALAESQGGQIVIPDGETDLEVPLGPKIATGRMLYLATNIQISFKLNGIGNQALDLQPPVTDPEVPGELYYDGDFTSLHLTNASGGPATVFFVIVGA